MKLPRVAGSLQSRFVLAVGCLVLSTMGITVVAVDARLSSLLLRETRSRGWAVASSIAATTSSALLHSDHASLRQMVSEAVRRGQLAYVVVLDRDRQVAARAERAHLAGMKIPAIVAETAAAARIPVLQSAVVDVDGTPVRVIDVAHPVYVEGSDVRWGTVRIGMDLEPMHREMTRLRVVLVAIGAAGALLALVAAKLISRRITRSIDDLVRGTIAVSEGDLDHRIEIDTDDEIATLAAHFNEMTAEVKKHQDGIAVAKRELEILNATLEEKVLARTRELLASEEKYRILVENSPDPILIVQRGVIRFVNPAFERAFGWELGGMVRAEFAVESLFHPEDRTGALDFLHRVTSGETVAEREIRGLTRAGEMRVFEMRGMRMNYVGEPAAEIILVDMTEKKELQRHLLQHEKLRALGELASGVAHDFNNILGIILGRSQLLQRRVDDPDVRRGLRTIERAAADGGETVRRIQEFARARTERDFEAIDVNHLLEEVVEITRTRWKDQAEVRNVKIDVILDLSTVPPVQGNASELREVYTNLIFNAVDAMPNGGAIRIRSSSDAANTIVEVEDGGKGMDEETKARIFEPFFTTKGAHGLGMGMSVVYGIVERHAGTITVESEPGRGTRFIIKIPRSREEPRPAAQESAVRASERARILLVDAEEAILELVSDILRDAGHEIRTATGGPEALAEFERDAFDLLLCDLGMREMSGWEVVSAVRARDTDLGVVLLTGWGATLSADKVRAYGIDAVLAKPFEMRELLETVDEVLGRRLRRAAT
jgi:PAS domain S-box-containing protein